ncbi:5-methyltetrahydropteroyltriglutamate--homocysteine S-methyltransferase [Halalkalibacterium ligniniphilum]|uniref:5-methyltetrahydropteroyltriglutamate-- homocysteine S-methyltransferase n=1 Tax=Halalkalibacterium ligniniphilum TaxID=1134413 RepID=UPI000344DCAF|nr:5-methyltetrahydropteroyltriglutamate--homocysteine S-methyltransferase [Halalkalibacterium ligniniphilum]
MTNVKTSSLGYPRIGENREWKHALEAFWAHKITEAEFESIMKELRLHHLNKQKKNGLDLIPVGDFTYYDHVLDTATMLGFIPERFDHSGEKVSLSTYFSMARGNQSVQASEMTKWFNTNYHYIVPEINGTTAKLTVNRPLQAYLEAKDELGINGKPVILGPFTFLKLSKGYQDEQFAEILKSLVPVYIKILKELQDAGATWVQLDEPSLVTTITKEEMDLISHVYKQFSQELSSLSIMLQTYFDSVSFYEDVINLPVKGIGLDFVHGAQQTYEKLERVGFPTDKVLGVGIVDGRNIWRSDLHAIYEQLQRISRIVPAERQILQPSSSLLHVPVSLAQESALDPLLKKTLAFADEKLGELELLKQALTDPSEKTRAKFHESHSAIKALAQSPWRTKAKGAFRGPSKRSRPFAERQALQRAKWSLPLLPTTTIGSFPQTNEIRRARNLWRKGELEETAYKNLINEKIKKWIEIQEEIGLDVFVHGEFERNDMVEFFGEKLAGFAFTTFGWVQSYGSRCVKPPIIFGDVAFIEPMTVEETAYAQSLTSKPVKGMLTGPVTILTWSFVRNDLPLKDVAFQIAQALIQEIEALEAAGIEMIQVDEPALREGLPLKQEDKAEYLAWAVESFQLATSTVKDTTQIHTHMCYSDFHEIIDEIRALDADVISIETSRSHGELITAFETNVYDKEIGLGVYDIHSPRIPSEEEMTKVIERAISVLPYELFWVNPDCGLKTRAEEETIAALTNMVKAAKNVRETLPSKNTSLQ